MRPCCRIGGHGNAIGAKYNNGFFFGRCGKCGTDLIRTGRGHWQEVPRGHAVVWKSGRHGHSLAADFAGLLPIPVMRAQLPATRGGFISWSRDLVSKQGRSGRRGTPASTAEAKRDEVEEKPYPRLVVIALLAGASMQLLLTLGRRRAL